MDHYFPSPIFLEIFYNKKNILDSVDYLDIRYQMIVMQMEKKESTLPFVSVIVPTLNRKLQLANCLTSILNLDYPKSKIEIIVVDNGSTDGTKEMICKKFKSIRVVLEKRPGASYARNTGGNVAKGEILAFTDDDCIVDRNWLKNLVNAFRSAKIGAVGGPVSLLRADIFPKNLLKWGGLGFFSLGEAERTTELIVSGNLAIRNKIFKTTKFDVIFGQRNTLIYRWEEDIEFSLRLLRLGYVLLFVPTAKVYHDVKPGRVGLKYVMDKEFSGGLSHYMVKRKYKGKLLIGINSLRSFIGALIVFYQIRSISSFSWLVKMAAMVIASIFLP